MTETSHRFYCCCVNQARMPVYEARPAVKTSSTRLDAAENKTVLHFIHNLDIFTMPFGLGNIVSFRGGYKKCQST